MRLKSFLVITISLLCTVAIFLFVSTDNTQSFISQTPLYSTSKPRVDFGLDSDTNHVRKPINESVRTPKTTVRPTSTPTVQENYHLKRTFCSMKFENGEMCPPLYTDLGGACSRNERGFLDCTDVRSLGSHSLRQAQLAMTRMLGIFDNIARKYNIKYWLTSATLLGAARHKGFIPWDSDVDIQMPLADYEKFFKKGSHDLPEDVFFQNTESDVNLRPEPEKYEAYKYKDIGMYIRIWNPRLRDRKSCYKYCIVMNCKWHDGLMVDIYVIESAPSGSYPLKELMFEGLSLLVQNNWKYVLRRKYGKDYMVVPKQGSVNRQQWDWPDPDHSCEQIMNQQ